MKIVFESSPSRFGFPFRIIGHAGRYDTISDCKFLDDIHIVCVDRQEAKLYLIQFDLSGSSYSILDSQTAVCNGEPQHFEIISIRPATATAPATLYSISYKNTLFSCEIINNKFCKFQTQIVHNDDKYHGVLALPDHPDTVYVTNMIRPTITEFNTKTGAKRSMTCEGGTRMKDVDIIDANHMVAISSDNGPINGQRNPDGSVSPHNPPYDSHVLVYNRHTGARVARHVFPNTQIDGCIYHAPYCYVTCTDVGGAGYIFRSKIDSDSGYKFTDICHIPCAGFPHGLAIRGDMFAYTSYSESALYIESLTDFFAVK